MVYLNVSQTALQVQMLKNPERIVPQNKVTLLADAVVAACDRSDGVKDGIVNNPLSCKFDGVLACKAGDAQIVNEGPSRIRPSALRRGSHTVSTACLSRTLAGGRVRLGRPHSCTRKADESAVDRHASIRRLSRRQLGPDDL